MGAFDGTRDGDGDLENLVERHTPTGGTLRHVLLGAVHHRDIGAALVRLPDRIDADHIGVLQGRHRRRLRAEAGQGGVVEIRIADDLDRDLPREGGLLIEIDVTEPAPVAEHPNVVIAGDVRRRWGTPHVPAS